MKATTLALLLGPESCAVTLRGHGNPNNREPSIGFRVVRRALP